MHDDVRRAYAVLGLPPGSSAAQLRRRYRALVRTWHPDRFASDPIGQAAASERLAQINVAYRLLAEGPPAAAPAAAPHERGAPPPDSTAWPHGRLSREEIDRMVEAIGKDSPIDTLNGWLDSLRAAAGPVGLIAVLLLLVVLEARAGHLLFDLLLFGFVLLVVRAWSWIKRRPPRGQP